MNENELCEAIKTKYNDNFSFDLTKQLTIHWRKKIQCVKCGKSFFKSLLEVYENGCPFCMRVKSPIVKCHRTIISKPMSSGEESISEILKKHSIVFIPQKRFDNCKDRAMLVFDFYLPDYNICIEYDGEQHYKHITFFHKTIEEFNAAKNRDEIKNKFCAENKIRILRVDGRFFKTKAQLEHLLKKELSLVLKPKEIKINVVLTVESKNIKNHKSTLFNSLRENFLFIVLLLLVTFFHIYVLTVLIGFLVYQN